MKTNIRYSIFGFIFWLLAFSVSLLGLTVLTREHDWLAILGWGIIFLIYFVMLLVAIKNIQWFAIANGSITVYSPFGVVKRIQIQSVKRAFKANVAVFSIKSLHVLRPHIVLSLKKSVIKADIEHAYNRKKKTYLVIPYTEKTELLICREYRNVCGCELKIESIQKKSPTD